jgi:hypothetical protein
MLTELLAASDKNDLLLPEKLALFKWGFGLLLLALMGSAVKALSG